MPSPDTRRGPGTAPRANLKSDPHDQLDANGIARLAGTSLTAAYLDGRHRVLGGRLVLHRQAPIAAALLIEAVGPLAARAWLRQVAEELGR